MAKTKTKKAPEAEAPQVAVTAVNREDWLNQLVTRLLPWFDEIKLPIEHTVRITCGWPAVGALSTKKRRIGECWKPEVSADKASQIFISPVLVDVVTVAATVAHELIHAAGKHDHRKGFEKVARQIGLEGPPTATVPGPEFEAKIAPVLAELGGYPHAAMSPSTQRKKQSTRLLKVICPSDAHEEYIVRMSAKTLKMAPPMCGVCGDGMIGPDVEDDDEDDDGGIVAHFPHPPVPQPELPRPLPEPRPHLIDYTWLPGLLAGLSTWAVETWPKAKAPKARKARKAKAAVEATADTAVEDDVIDPDTLFAPVEGEGYVQAQCAGGDGYRACRTYNGKTICDRCWRKRVAIAGKPRGGSV